MPQVIAFIGFHNSGKTTIIRKIAAQLKTRGYEIGIIKSTKHSLFPFDKEGSDTDLYERDGIKKITLTTPDLICHIDHGKRPSLNFIANTFFNGVDLVIAEGFKNEEDVKKIEVARKNISHISLKEKTKGVIASVSDFPIGGIPNFSFDEVSKLTDFVEERLKLKELKQQTEITLFVNGRRIPLKKFVRDSLSNTVLGYISALKFTQNAREVILRIKLNQQK